MTLALGKRSWPELPLIGRPAVWHSSKSPKCVENPDLVMGVVKAAPWFRWRSGGQATEKVETLPSGQKQVQMSARVRATEKC
jgi:hypothetical protein